MLLGGFMSRYLGNISIYNFYVNFKPIYLIDRGEFIKLTNADKEELFPGSDIMNINIYNSSMDRADFVDSFDDRQLYIIDLSQEWYEENFDARTGGYNKTRYKIDLASIDRSHYGPIDEFDYYYYLKSEEAPGDFYKSFRTIDNSWIQERFRVVIETDDRAHVAGPFVVTQRQDGEKVVVTHQRDSRGKDVFYVNTFELTNEPNEIQSVFTGEYTNTKFSIFYAGKRKSSYLDIISDEELVKNFRESISNKVANNGTIALSDLETIVSSYNATNRSGVPREIQNNRVERLKSILTSEKDRDEQAEIVSELIVDVLINNKNSETLTPIFQKLSENEDFMSSVQQIRVLRDKIQKYEDAAEIKKDELQQIEDRIAEKKNEELEERLNKEYEELNNKINNADAELSALSDKIAILKGSMSEQEYLDHLKDDVSYYERVNKERIIESEKIEKNIDNIFNERTERALNLTFDGMISQKMIQAAATWETEKQNRQYDEIVETIAKRPLAQLSKDDLINYLCGIVGSYRPNYDKNTIINLYVCLAQGFLTVFSGAPGAGKTSICNIIAHSLGLTLPRNYINSDNNVDPNRYIDVSVERGWTSKRDFIGYYNPLTKKFDRNNSRLFDALNILDIEARNNKTNRPFVILLDEANLSPMEYYWADFMNVCDDLNENSSIDLGESYRFRIPDELRFVATINNDHTTESLSPRLIDRAWIVKLPATQTGLGKTTELSKSDSREVLWSDFISVFGEETNEISGTAKEIYDGFILKSRKIVRVSPRSDSAIRRYWGVASKLMVKDESVMVDPSIIALDYAICQKILPQISGSGESVEESLKEMKAYAQDKNLNMTSKMIDDIIIRGKNTMNFFQYFG